MTTGDAAPWPKSGTSDVALGHLGTRLFIAAIEPWHGNEVVIYTLSREGWQRRTIDDTIADGHALIAVDIDDDGRDEVVVGQRGGDPEMVREHTGKRFAWAVSNCKTCLETVQ